MPRFSFDRTVVLSHGFRPFFLLALIFAVCVIPYWMAVFFGLAPLSGPFVPLDWHIHEMIFGYASAVITGFLFTAIPNWTSRLPIRGWPLAFLVCVWLAGRLAVLGFVGSEPIGVMLVDVSFISVVFYVAVKEIVAGKNWRNLVLMIPLGIFLAANILFHIEAIAFGGTDYSRRLGLAIVLFLITLIGGRIIPSFTRNWLVKSSAAKLPAPFNKFDGICLVTGAISLLFWVCFPDAVLSRTLLVGSAVLHAMRLLRWRSIQTLSSPLLFILHLAYAFVPSGLFLLGLGLSKAGFHMLGIGAMAGMTVAVMIRAGAGHTGRALTMETGLIVGFCFLPLALAVRTLAQASDALYQPALLLSAAFWTLGFGIVLGKIGPWLWSANFQKRNPNPR